MIPRRAWLVCVLLSVARCAVAAGAGAPQVVWQLHEVHAVGGLVPEVGGEPRALVPAAGGPGLVFDGVDDGLWLAANPLAGRAAFTIELLIRPAAGGPAEQRYFHVEDAAGRRGLLELRMVGTDAWCLDTFLKCGDAKLTLIDPAKTHPAGRWTWVALRYDGRKMSAWVDGVKELEGDVAFAPLGPGRISLGTRQDRRSWYRGAIREVRFSAEALEPERLQRGATE
ncbi:MAG: hypothetical protein QM691_06260 [Opitutaceae bacterium]